jgi:hypothetical protein
MSRLELESEDGGGQRQGFEEQQMATARGRQIRKEALARASATRLLARPPSTSLGTAGKGKEE